MPAKNPRINVTFENKTASILSDLAKYENKSVASLVRELTVKALELREDFYLSEVAKKIDVGCSKVYNHADAWK
jgi:predicted DNA-binding protein